jgi:hypothetical protein
VSWSPGDVIKALSMPNGPTPTRLAMTLIITNFALLIPLLVLARRWTLPFGTATSTYAVLGLLVEATHAFTNPIMFLTLVLAGIAVDIVASRLRPGPDRQREYWIFGGLASLVTWAVYFATMFFAAGQLPSVTEFWTGMPVEAGLLGFLFAVLLFPGQHAFSRPGVDSPR